MKSNELIAKFLEVLDVLDQSGRRYPGIIMSAPGLGKTSTIEMWCGLKGYKLTTLIASQYSQDDILGIQSVVNGKLERLTPAWYNRMVEGSDINTRHVLFIDEITTCDEFIQAPLLNLIFSGDLGAGHKLPNNTMIVTAGNYSEDLNGAFSMTAPLVNRFIILNINPSDCDMFETLRGDFAKASKGSDKDKRDYLGFESNISEIAWSISKLRSFFSRRPFTIPRVINNSKEGLVGFTSIRSITYAMAFAEEYFKRYTDMDWTRIVGDTLGVAYPKSISKSSSKGGGKDYLLIRNELMSSLSSFRYSKNENSESDINNPYDTPRLKKVLVNFMGGRESQEDIEFIKSGLVNGKFTSEQRTEILRISATSSKLSSICSETSGE